MNSNRIVNQIDVTSGHPQRYKYKQRTRPKVTIRNIVTVDSSQYNKPRDTDYDRAKFLNEERDRYWKSLNILYNDYTLVNLKQKELLKAEDNYANQHCIEETVKLLNALKEKIQTQCKDIVFITNLFGDTEVNPVVQSLANGEDIDRIIRRQNKGKQKTQLKRTKTNKNVKYSSKVEMKNKEKRNTSVPIVRRKGPLNEPKFVDSELHWCQVCNVFPPTIKKYLEHLHDESHKKKIKALRINEQPWHKCLPEEQSWRTESTDTVRVKGFNFFTPVNGWFCQLCRSWMGDIHCAATHLRSYVHNMNLKNFQEKFPDWKQNWLDKRSKALEKTLEVKTDLNTSLKDKNGKKIGRKKDDSESSSEEENLVEPISRHRNMKTKMWVPNQKAFERVCNEINPVPTDAECSLAKNKSLKKDRPPFIGKMPLITSFNKSKKIVMKDLPPNTSEKIVASCAAFDQSQNKLLNEWSDVTSPKSEEENDLKLKEFIKVAKKVKKGSRKKQQTSRLPIPIDCYNTTDYVPIVENSDALENLIGPVSIAQWEADMNYEYHMRQMQQYALPPPPHIMHNIPPPQTFLLDPYHAIALHNQQFHSAQQMISNQYENFEIISRDEEQSLSQYLDQKSPSPSPISNILKSNSENKQHDPLDKTQTTSGIVSESSQQSDSKSSHLKEKKDNIKASKKLKLSSTSVIKKPPCPISSRSNSTSDLLPTFTETFLRNTDGSGGFISSLLSACPDVKIVSSNEFYKKRITSRRRRKNYKKIKNQNKVDNNDDILSADCMEDEAKGIVDDDMSQCAPPILSHKNLKKNVTNEENNDTVKSTQIHESPKKQGSPMKNETLSLKEKINSIRKMIDKVEKRVEESVPNKRRVKNNLSIKEVKAFEMCDMERQEESGTVNERVDGRVDKSDDSNDETADVDKLIYYDIMTSI